MVTILYSRRARTDLLDIWIWVAGSGGVDAADAVVERIDNRIKTLERHPEIGPARPAIDPAARMLVVERWLVLYAFDGHQVRVVRIVDGVVDLRKIAWSDE